MSSLRSPTQKLTAWVFTAVSSGQQAETLPFQKAWAAETAIQHGWKITDAYNGVSSGRDGTRPLLDEVLEKLEKTPRSERPERVLMVRLDRMGRGLGLEALAALAKITQLGVTIHTRQDGDYRITRASDSILPLMRIVTGGIENEARRDKAVATYKRRREKGQVISNKRPYGLKVVASCDVPAEPAAGAVRMAFELAANGFGYAAIGTRLRAIAPPKTYSNGRSHETEWTNDRVRKLLRNQAYRGVVVDERRWERVRELLDGAPDVRTRTHGWPLSGALRCTCGRNLIGSLRGSPARRVYRCSAVSTHKGHRTYPASSVEGQFVDLFNNLTASPKLIRAYAAQSSKHADLDQAVLSKKRSEASKNLAAMEAEDKRIWELNRNGLLPDVHLAKQLAKIEQKAAAFRAILDELDIEDRRVALAKEDLDFAQSLVKEAATLWEGAETSDKACAARALSRALSGLCVLEDGSLRVGPPTEWSRFFKQPESQGPCTRESG